MSWLGFQGRGFKVKVTARSNIYVSYRGAETSTSTLGHRSVIESLLIGARYRVVPIQGSREATRVTGVEGDWAEN